MSNEVRGAGFWTGLLAGGIVGAVIGLLLAPQPGPKTREQLREKTGELIARGRSLVEEGKEVFHDAVEKGKEAAAKARSEIEARFEKAVGEDKPE